MPLSLLVWLKYDIVQLYSLTIYTEYNSFLQNRAEDRIFTTAVSVVALINTWTKWSDGHLVWESGNLCLCGLYCQFDTLVLEHF